jgi:hypothetical protein
MAKKYNVVVDQDDITSIATSVCNSVQKLNDIGDVVIGNDVTDGHVVTYDSILQKWVNEPISITIDGGVY